jgi:hypothetical protein
LGTDFYIVNVSKRQYLSPDCFGDFAGTHGYMKGGHSTAVAMLVCDPRALGLEQPAGSWSGDLILVATDAAPPDQFGIPTATGEEPDRNLYMLAWQEYRDISYQAIAMVCDWAPEFADRLAERVKFEMEHQSSESLKTYNLWHLGNVLAATRCLPLESALSRHVGLGWENNYERACGYWSSQG